MLCPVEIAPSWLKLKVSFKKITPQEPRLTRSRHRILLSTIVRSAIYSWDIVWEWIARRHSPSHGQDHCNRLLHHLWGVHLCLGLVLEDRTLEQWQILGNMAPKLTLLCISIERGDSSTNPSIDSSEEPNRCCSHCSFDSTVLSKAEPGIDSAGIPEGRPRSGPSIGPSSVGWNKFAGARSKEVLSGQLLQGDSMRETF